MGQNDPTNILIPSHGRMTTSITFNNRIFFMDWICKVFGNVLETRVSEDQLSSLKSKPLKQSFQI